MQSRTTERFRSLLSASPKHVQEKVRTAYRLWSNNPQHPSLRFKKVHAKLPVYSVRIDLDWRAVGILDDGAMVWFWIGSHADYAEVDHEALRRDLTARSTFGVHQNPSQFIYLREMYRGSAEQVRHPRHSWGPGFENAGRNRHPT